MNDGLNRRYEKLKEIITSLGKVVVAFSGGVDSTFLLKVCMDSLGSVNVIAVNAVSPTYPERERNEAAELARSAAGRLITFAAAEMENPDFVANGPDRCYHCKTELFRTIREIARKEGFAHVLEGSNADDLSDYRPGQRACTEAGAISPLVDAGLSKEDIRALSKELGLPTHNKPAQACLASRIPYGMPVTIDRLRRIELSEAFIRDLGIAQVRVRHDGSTARIEVEEKDLSAILAYRDAIAEKLTALGFMYVSLDLQGYRAGSMNDEIVAEGDGLA